MAIKLVPFSPGTLIKSSEANGHNNLLFNNEILTKIDQLIDRDVVRSNDKVSPFVEAYTSADGRKNSVVTGENTAIFSNNKYNPSIIDEASVDTTQDPNSFTNPTQAFDDNISTAATYYATSTFTVTLGKTFASKLIKNVRVIPEMSGQNIGGSTSVGWRVKLQTFDGTTWSDHSTLDTQPNNNKIAKQTFFINLNQTISGIRVEFFFNRLNVSGNNATAHLYMLEYGDLAEGEVHHTIPSGTFNDNVSSGVAAVKIVDWEDGASLQWKAISYEDITSFYTAQTTVNSGFSNPENFFDLNKNTFATASSGSSYNASLGKTFSPTFIKRVYVKADQNVSGSGTATVRVEKYDGSTWTTVQNLFTNNNSFEGYVNVDETVQGLRLFTNGNTSSGGTSRYYYIFVLGDEENDTDWKDFNISGTTAYAKISEFTAFTSEPTAFVVKLIPKSVSPLPGVPSISGAGIKLL